MGNLLCPTTETSQTAGSVPVVAKKKTDGEERADEVRFSTEGLKKWEQIDKSGDGIAWSEALEFFKDTILKGEEQNAGRNILQALWSPRRDTQSHLRSVMRNTCGIQTMQG